MTLPSGLRLAINSYWPAERRLTGVWQRLAHVFLQHRRRLATPISLRTDSVHAALIMTLMIVVTITAGWVLWSKPPIITR